MTGPRFHDYAANGMPVIPVACDGTKSPASWLLPVNDEGRPTWDPFTRRLPSMEECDRWQSERVGIGMVCGAIAGGHCSPGDWDVDAIEVFDFDEDAETIFPKWLSMLPADLANRLTIIRTGGGGFHVPFFYPVDFDAGPTGSRKLAQGPRDPQTKRRPVLIETRGQNAYVVAPGSPAHVHASGNPYEQIQGATLPELPFLEIADRFILTNAATKIDEPYTVAEAQRVEDEAKKRPRTNHELDTDTPWGDFDANASWEDVLEPHGWKRHSADCWTRPGKSFGVSAKTVPARDGSEVLTVYSGSAGPLAPENGAYQSFGKFAALALLQFNGDRSAAAKHVIGLGFGRNGQQDGSVQRGDSGPIPPGETPESKA